MDTEKIKNTLWMVHTKKADFDGIAAKFGIDKVTARILRNRDIVGDEAIDRFLNGDLSHLHDPFLMKDMDRAVEIILSKCDEGAKIRVVGDYDIDGVCSVSILCMALMELGADVDYDIPDRRKDGYGINKRIVDAAEEDGVDTIITCDNGISARETVKYAKDKGMTVIVTDHHEIPYELIDDCKEAAVSDSGYDTVSAIGFNETEASCENGDKNSFENSDKKRKYILPEADAVVDHKREDCDYPYKELCGAGIAFKLACALGVSEELQRELLKFAAFATVGDVVELHDENRTIVKYGLQAINADENGLAPDTHYRDINDGLAGLIEKTKLSGKKINSYHIGFVLGPCVNAAGRLASAKTAAELFLGEGDPDTLSAALKAYNDERRKMTEDMTALAEKKVREGEMSGNVLVIYLPECHEAVAGIVAGRIKESFYKPTFVITDSDDPGEVKGSGRSIEGYHMYDELVKCKDLLNKFGGHEMAAGFSIKKENLEAFRKTLNANETLTEDELTKNIWIDVPMPLAYAHMGLVEEMERLEPFGTGNPKPVFADKDLSVTVKRVFGEAGKVVKLTLKNPAGKQFSAVMFKSAESNPEPDEGDVISILYYPSVNEFNGNKSLQFVIQDFF